jgi:hypothetical protein
LRAPPIDLEMDKLNKSRLRRVVSAMGIKPVFEAWLSKKRQYDADPDVVENDSVGATIEKLR